MKDARTMSPEEYRLARAEIVRPRRYSPPVAPTPEPVAPASAQTEADDRLIESTSDQPLRGPMPIEAAPVDVTKLDAASYAKAKAAMLSAARRGR